MVKNMVTKKSTRSHNHGNVITIDPDMMYARKLHHDEKHSGWHIFKSIFWAIYLFVMGAILYLAVPQLSISKFFGWALIILAIFLIIYGFSKSLHLKLMKRYA